MGLFYTLLSTNSTKAYPMVVYVSENTSKKVNDFVIPTLYSKDGFNTLITLQKGTLFYYLI